MPQFFDALFKFIVGTSLFILVLGTSVALFILGYTRESGMLFFYAAFILTSIFIVFSGWLLLSSVASLIANVTRSINDTLPRDPKLKLISFGIVGFFFAPLLAKFVRAFFYFTSTFFTILVLRLLEHSDGFSRISCDFSSDVERCSSILIVNLISLWNNAIGDAYSRSGISGLPFIGLVIFAVFWVVCIEILHQAQSIKATLPDRRTWFQSYLLNSVSRNNAFFFVLLGVALYLSIASIAAIPTLQGPAEDLEEISPTSLQSTLEASVSTFKDQYKLNSEQPYSELVKASDGLFVASSDDPMIAEISTTRAKVKDAKAKVVLASRQLSNETNQETDVLYSEVDYTNAINAFSGYEELLNKIEVFWVQRKVLNPSFINSTNTAFNLVGREVDSKLLEAVSSYERSGINRKGDREAVDHFFAMKTWFEEYMTQVESQLNQCVQSIDSFNQDTGNRISSILRSMKDADILSAAYLRGQIEDEFSYLQLSYSYQQSCRFSNSLKPVPQRAPLGGYLGPFRFVARWLVGTESLPLTLITGLLGFGLLGSACSSFVRERVDPSITIQNGELVQDLPKVIVIGLSAAIIVFLAVMGGLAVFFTSNSQPNPYALLLGCLIASAFGENVWQWAQAQLNEKISASNRQGESSDESQ